MKPQTDLIKDKVSMAMPSGTEWAGVIDELQIGNMYKVKNSAATSLYYNGKEVNPATVGINLVTGWNWIGFTPRVTMPIAHALAGANPVAGDVVKDKSSFAVYSGTEWIGLLTYLKPGAGYMYQSSANKEFYYPSAFMSRMPMRAPENVNFNHTPNRDPYQSNMNVIAKVMYDDGTEAVNVELGAFVGAECRGTEITRTNNLVFLTIAGESSRNEVLTFKVFDRASGNEMSAFSQHVKFVNDTIYGKIENPMIVTIPRVATGLNSQADVDITVSPTLVKDLLRVNSANAELKRIVIGDINGKMVYVNDKPEMYNEIRMGEFLKGVYFVEVITVDNVRKVERIVKN